MRSARQKNITYKILHILIFIILLLSIPMLLLSMAFFSSISEPAELYGNASTEFTIWTVYVPLTLTIIPSIWAIVRIKKNKKAFAVGEKNRIILLLPLIYVILIPLIGFIIRGLVPSVAQAITISDSAISTNDPFCCPSQPEFVLAGAILWCTSFLAVILMTIPWFMAVNRAMKKLKQNTRKK